MTEKGRKSQVIKVEAGFFRIGNDGLKRFCDERPESNDERRNCLFINSDKLTP